MIRHTDYGMLVGETTFRFVDGVEAEVIVPGNIRATRPLKVWIVKPGPSWMVAGEIESV